jgi:hypothetical protein
MLSFQLEVFKSKDFFYSILKKHNFFSWVDIVYILMGFKSHIWKKKHRVSPRSQVDRVWPRHCTGWSFDKPRLVQPPGPRSTCRASPGLIAIVSTPFPPIIYIKMFWAYASTIKKKKVYLLSYKPTDKRKKFSSFINPLNTYLFFF